MLRSGRGKLGREVMKSSDGLCKLSARDIQILKFCLEMKFSDTESLNTKFFKSRSVALRLPKKRLLKLSNSGYLKPLQILPGSLKLTYMTTSKGAIAVSEMLGVSPCKPAKKMGTTFIEHDLFVLKCRLLLEEQGRATNWVSENELKNTLFKLKGSVRRDFIPDGIFTSLQGLRCAFEFENSTKSKDQMLNKLINIHQVIKRGHGPFSACLFVTKNERLKAYIETLSEPFSKYIRVESFKELEAKSGK
jgi:hypothetical protein